jgi:hypothetical protein
MPLDADDENCWRNWILMMILVSSSSAQDPLVGFFDWINGPLADSANKNPTFSLTRAALVSRTQDKKGKKEKATFPYTFTVARGTRVDPIPPIFCVVFSCSIHLRKRQMARPTLYSH